jgi:ferrous iron transport protein B
VTVERKEGAFVTPHGRQVSVVDLPGTYSLRGRSPDEEITRDMVLGRTAGETAPDLVLCVADATNLRLTIRLVLELKSIGRPLALVLNMFDIATRRGVTVDVAKFSASLGIPVVTSVAVRKGGTAELLRLTDEIAATAQASVGQNLWQPLTAAQLRTTQREADRIIAESVSLPARPDTWTARIDAVVLHPVGGLLILALILFVMFQAVFAWAQPLMELLSSSFGALGQLVHDKLPAGLLQSFLQNGVISGVGSVVVFLPQIIIIFLFILLLEDFGYMARAAFLMDRIMGGAGLHGRAFIPLLSSFACAIPGIMATRSIPDEKDRLTTILIAPLMTCSARLPVYTLIIGAFIPARNVGGSPIGLQGLVLFTLFISGIVGALLVALVLRRSVTKGNATGFMMEMPRYQWPRLNDIVIALWQRAWIFLRRAGTIIAATTVILWLLLTFPQAPAGQSQVEYSVGGRIASGLEVLVKPIGFNHDIALALIPAMAAREVAVSAMATANAIDAGGDEEAMSEQLGTRIAGRWSIATALAFLAWFVFAPQCISTIAITRRETNGWKWPLFMVGYLFALAYAAAGITYWTAVAFGLG